MQKDIVSILRPKEQGLLQYKNQYNGIYEYKNQAKENATANDFYSKKNSRAGQSSYSMDNSVRKQTPHIQLRKIQKAFNGKHIDNFDQEYISKNINQFKLLTTYASDFNNFPNVKTIKKQRIQDELNKTYDLIQNNQKTSKSPLKQPDNLAQTVINSHNLKHLPEADHRLLDKRDLIIKNNNMVSSDTKINLDSSPNSNNISPLNRRHVSKKQRTRSVYSLDKKGNPIADQNPPKNEKQARKVNCAQIQTQDNICDQFEKKSDIESCASNLNMEEYQKIQQNLTPEQKQQQEQQTRLIQQLQNKSQFENDNNCFSVDYSFLDNISMSDPRLQKLLNDDLLSSKNIDLEYILEQNADYFHHLFNNCACAKCTCGRCRCNFAQLKLNYKNGYQSVYKKEYSIKSGTSQSMITPPLFEKTYDNLADKQKKDPIFDPTHTTTQKGDFVKHPLPKKLIIQQPPKMNLPISTLTTYACSFVNWKEYDPSFQFKNPHFKTVLNYKNKIEHKTTYNVSFENNLSDNKIQSNAGAGDVKKIQQNNPLPDLWSDQNQISSYKDNFRNYSMNDIVSNDSQIPPADKNQAQLPNWAGQFKSVNHNDFSGQKERACPAQTNSLTKPWKAKLLNKMRLMKQLREERKQQQLQLQSSQQQQMMHQSQDGKLASLIAQQQQISPMRKNQKLL